MKIKYYGVSNGEQGCGIGDIIEGHDYSFEDETYSIHVFVNENKPELGHHKIECYSIFHIIDSNILYVSL